MSDRIPHGNVLSESESVNPSPQNGTNLSRADSLDFHDLLIKHLPALRQQAMAMTRNRADAEDLLQTSVASALAAKKSFEPGTNFRAWMGSIIRNRFLSNCRRRRETVSIDDAPPSMLSRSGGQEENLAMAELRHHMARLSAEQRLLLLLISVEGRSYEEVSQQTGVPVGTLKARVSRTRKQLRVWILGDEDAHRRTVVSARPLAVSRSPLRTGSAREDTAEDRLPRA